VVDRLFMNHISPSESLGNVSWLFMGNFIVRKKKTTTLLSLATVIAYCGSASDTHPYLPNNAMLYVANVRLYYNAYVVFVTYVCQFW